MDNQAKFRNFFLDLSSKKRRAFLIAIDSFLIVLAIFLTFLLKYGHTLEITTLQNTWLISSSLIVGLPTYILSGQYSGLTRYVDSSAMYKLAIWNLLLIITLMLSGEVLNFNETQITTWILLWLVLTVLTGTIRLVMRDILLSLSKPNNRKIPSVVIYGAGATGAQLAASLRISKTHRIVAFIDDSPQLWNRRLYGIPIYPPQKLDHLNESIDQLLVAITSLTKQSLKSIVENLQKKGIKILRIPSLNEITSGKAKIDSLKPIAIEDILGRDGVIPNQELLGPGIRGSVICVTGAGGSIGSELCRKIMNLNPKMLVLLDNSEVSLYSIQQELLNNFGNTIPIQSILGSSINTELVNEVFRKFNVEVVFHAAAYKHVPLVESNPFQGIANNVFSTIVICKSAITNNLRQVVLISTDKAVRPTNIMGASKRLAELIMQAFSVQLKSNLEENKSKLPIIFSMVRFGNVLGSSGSVVPLFRNQIEKGGPITITHPEMIRYFMTISEAAELVIQSSVLASGGEVFLLDMGDPIKINTLATQMIQLSGLTVRNQENPNGDIEIVHTGLRPGEKLFEELLIDGKAVKTIHPLIYKANENCIEPDKLWPLIDSLKIAIKERNLKDLIKLLKTIVPEWESNNANNL